MDGTWWILMSRRFRICMAKGGRGYPGTRVLKAELRAAEGLPYFKKNAFAVFQKNISPNPRNWACPRKTKGRSDLHWEAQFRKFWSFFATPHNFANRPHFVALIQLQVAKTRSTKFCALQHPPKSAMIIGVFRRFFGQNRFSQPNGQFLPIACHTYSESYCSDG